MTIAFHHIVITWSFLEDIISIYLEGWNLQKLLKF